MNRNMMNDHAPEGMFNQRAKSNQGAGSRFKNGPVRLSHTHEIDFSGTGGSSNMARNPHKSNPLLGNLLETGKFKPILTILEKQNHQMRGKFSINRVNDPLLNLNNLTNQDPPKKSSSSKNRLKHREKQSYQSQKKKVMFPLNHSDNHFYKAARLIDDVDDMNKSNGFSGSSWNNVSTPYSSQKLTFVEKYQQEVQGFKNFKFSTES